MTTETIQQIADAAVATEKATGCPAELLTAQCALESAWLRFAPGNNAFGIKAYPGNYGRQLLRTTEWFNFVELRQFLNLGDGRTAVLRHPDRLPTSAAYRREYSVQDWFATFATLEDCFAKRASMFAAGRYTTFATKFQADRDLAALVRGIAPIYATDPQYADSVLAIARQPSVQTALAKARGIQPIAT